MISLRATLLSLLLMCAMALPSLADTATVRLAIHGMTCGASCAKGVRDKLQSIAGVKTVDVDFTRAMATVTYDSKLLTGESVAAMLAPKSYGRYSATVIKPKS